MQKMISRDSQMPAARDERLLGTAVKEEKAFDLTMVVLHPVLQPDHRLMMSDPKDQKPRDRTQGHPSVRLARLRISPETQGPEWWMLDGYHQQAAATSKQSITVICLFERRCHITSRREF